ncbi:MAG TPA: FmdB family transcriptional regulator [Clostridiales bacterium]|nr:FmdB family transcriptional regulator [Clostridiales bacterium]
MPYYDLRCKACNKEFNIKASIQERSDRLISCPDCKSPDLETVYKKVNIVTRLNKDCDVCPSSMPSSHRCSGGCCGH